MLGNKSKTNVKATDTLIGECTICEGKIISEASLRIEGQMNGDIECAGDITVGHNAVVQSSIRARDVVVAGKVRGDIYTKGKLTVLSTGVLIGNIDVRSFVIQEGGIFQGSSLMNQTDHGADLAGGGKVVDAKAHKKKNEQAQAAVGG